MVNLAGLFQAQDRFGEAEPLLKRAAALLDRAGAAQRRNLADVLDQMAAVQRATGRTSDADANEARAATLRASFKACAPRAGGSTS
jgi:hypothetical protein